jgi:hypothetical protein
MDHTLDTSSASQPAGGLPTPAGRARGSARSVVALIPAGVGLDAALAVMRGLGECYPSDTLSLGTDQAGGMRVVHDPNAGRAAAPTTRVEVDLGVDDVGDLFAFAFGADDQQDAVRALALALVGMLEQAGAANYLTFAVDAPEVGRYAVTIQRCAGTTPAERIADLEAQLAALRG